VKYKLITLTFVSTLAFISLIPESELESE